MLAQRAPSLTTSRWTAVVEAIARVRLEDWSGAFAAIGDRFRLPRLMILTPMAYDFLRSLICSHLGRNDEAHGFYERGMVAWEDETGDDPAAWQHSDAMRWRRAAEAVLAK